MHVDQLYPSRFLRCADLNGQSLVVTIADLKREDVGGENKVIMTFTNGTKALILNKTNARAIAKALGTSETRDWRGKSVLLVPALVDFKGDQVDAIRVKAVPQERPSSDEPPFDDNIDTI